MTIVGVAKALQSDPKKEFRRPTWPIQYRLTGDTEGQGMMARDQAGNVFEFYVGDLVARDWEEVWRNV